MGRAAGERRGLRSVHGRATVAIAVVGVVIAAAVAVTVWRRPPRLERRKMHVVTLRSDWREGSLIASEDGRHTAYIVGKEGGAAVVTDGKAGPGFRQCAWVWISRGGASLRTYFVQDHEKRLGLVAGDTTVPLGFSKRDWLTFSPDGARWTLLASPRDPADGKAVVLVDGQVVGRHADASVPRFDREGRTVTYLAGEPDGTTMLMRDGVERRRFEPAQNACTSSLPPPDEGPGLQRLYDVQVLPDGRAVVLTTDRDGWAVYREADRLASYAVMAPGAAAGLSFSIEAPECQRQTAVAGGSLAVASHAPVAAWWARLPNEQPERGALWQVVRDGVPLGAETCQRPWDAQPPVLSADGRSVAYPCVVSAVGARETIFVVHDERWYGPYAEVWGIAISDDGRHVAFGASYGDGPEDWRVHQDGQPGRHRYAGVWRPRFSPDGKHLAWQAQRKARGSDNVLGLDRHELSGFGDVVAGPAFAADGATAWVIRRGRRVRRLEVKWP